MVVKLCCKETKCVATLGSVVSEKEMRSHTCLVLANRGHYQVAQGGSG